MVSVEAARCTGGATGHFEIIFVRMKETGPNLESRERFTWQPPTTIVQLAFRADEAAGSSRFGDIDHAPIWSSRRMDTERKKNYQPWRAP